MSKVVNLNDISKVKKFVDIAQSVSEDVTLISEHTEKNLTYVVDGKSILGIFSLDLSKNIYLKTPEKVVHLFKEFFVE